MLSYDLSTSQEYGEERISQTGLSTGPRTPLPKRLSVLMVTGVYHPEVSGAANQCRQLVQALKHRTRFRVLTTTRDSNLPPRCEVDGVEIFRVLLKGKSLLDYFIVFLRFSTFFLFSRKDFQIIHLHGFSLKSALLTVLSRIFHKKVIIKMTSVGHDDPVAMRQRGFLINYFFSKADAYVGVSPQFEGLYRQSRLPLNRLKQIPNGVDTNRFRPITTREKVLLRDKVKFPQKMKLILFVGHFSREKGPDILLKTWKRYVAETFLDTGIVFVGSKNPDHYEVDTELVKDIHQMAEPYIDDRIFFIESTDEIEKVYKAADLFVLPSLREGLPNSLLEAMACGLPVIVSRLEGITDWVIADGVMGLLVEPSIRNDLGRAIKSVLNDDTLAGSFGREARRTVLDRFSMKRVLEQYSKLYGDLIFC